MERVDCAVIGGGVVGLAISRALSMAGREVVLLEALNAVGTVTSSRNSEVIHAGMHYEPGSLKARLCVEGNAKMRAFAVTHNVGVQMVGKLIIAANDAETATIRHLYETGVANGVKGLELISAADVKRMEPEVICVGALYSPNTGIVDSHALMLAIQGEAETHGMSLALETPVSGGRATDEGVVVDVGGATPTQFLANTVVISAGHGACALGRAFGLPNVPTPYLCKGNYFSLLGKAPFQKLIYPVPESASLGVHYTLDMSGRGRFGPDAEWIDTPNYDVDPGRAQMFYDAIARYWPPIRNRALEPAYAGIRPKIHPPGKGRPDFMIVGPKQHGVKGIIGLFGIESPGLTSSLAIGDYVAAMAAGL
jgi:L-2-hydroxyglutarate oxidase LhgO